jgi:hypothetical protein
MHREVKKLLPQNRAMTDAVCATYECVTVCATHCLYDVPLDLVTAMWYWAKLGYPVHTGKLGSHCGHQVQ